MSDANPQNYLFHQTLEDDIASLEGGLLTFTVRINNGVVTDYILISYDKKLRIPQTDRKRD